MSPFERLARANALKVEVANVNQLREELCQRPPGHIVEIAVRMRAAVVDCDGVTRVDTWTDFGPALSDGVPGLTVCIPAGSPPADVRACLMEIAADYESSYGQITARSEELASEVLDGDPPGVRYDDDLPF